MNSFLLADDHEMVRLGVSNFLKQKYPTANIFQVGNLNEINNIVNQNRIDLAIIDIKMPGGSTIDLVKSLKLSHPDLKILIFTALNESQYGKVFLKLGVDGFLSKLRTKDEILKAIETIANGDKYLSSDLAYKVNSTKKNKDSVLNTLSPRELEIIDLIAEGYGNLEISQELDLKTSTVSTYKKRIIEKFRVENLVELVDSYRQQMKEQEE